MTRALAACRRLMSIPNVGQLTARLCRCDRPPSRIRGSRDIGAYFDLVPTRYVSGEVDYVGSIWKCGDRRVWTLLYKVANARRSTMRKARITLEGRRAIIMHAMLRDEIEFAPAWTTRSSDTRPHRAAKRSKRPREGADDRANCDACGASGRLRLSSVRPRTAVGDVWAY